MKIYFSGSIYGGRQKLKVYQELVKELSKYGKVLNPEVADEDVLVSEASLTDESVFQSLEKRLEEADVIFAELTVPSLGVGYELGYADSHHKRIIGIYDKTVIPKVSTMIRGNKKIKIIPYTDLAEIINQLENILKK